MRLSAVVDYLTSLNGNNALGQLLVYRVFLRVPPELLQAEDIAIKLHRAFEIVHAVARVQEFADFHGRTA